MLLILDRGPALPNGAKPNPLASIKVRQALNYAIDRREIFKALFGAYGAPTSEILSVDGSVPAYSNYYPYDPVKARALLVAAGYPKGFTISALSDSWFGTLGDPVLDTVAQDQSAVGVTLHITEQPSFSAWIPAILGGTYSVGGYWTSLTPMSEAYGYWFAPHAIENQHGWDDPTLDMLDQEGTASATPSNYWRAMRRRILSQADAVPVFSSRCVLVRNQGNRRDRVQPDEFAALPDRVVRQVAPKVPPHTQRLGGQPMGLLAAQPLKWPCT